VSRPLDPRVGGWSFDPWPEDVPAFRVGELAALLRLRADIAGGYVTEDPALIRRLRFWRWAFWQGYLREWY
jgi:hypothetical protein